MNIRLLCVSSAQVANFTPFCSTAILRKCTEWHQNDIKHYKVKCTLYVLLVPKVTNFTPFRSMTSCFADTGHSETSALNDPKMTINPTKSNVPHIYITSVPESHILLSFALRPEFSRYMQFWNICTELLHIDLEPYKAKLSYICVTALPESQISLHFALPPPVFEIQAIFRQVSRMTLNWPRTLQGRMYLIYVLLVSTSPIFHSFSLYDQPFSSYRLFWQSAPNDHKKTLNTTRSKAHICVTNVSDAEISIRFPLRSAIFEIQVTLRLVHLMTLK